MKYQSDGLSALIPDDGCPLSDLICNAEMAFLRKKTFFCKKGDRFTPFFDLYMEGYYYKLESERRKEKGRKYKT